MRLLSTIRLYLALSSGSAILIYNFRALFSFRLFKFNFQVYFAIIFFLNKDTDNFVIMLL